MGAGGKEDGEAETFPGKVVIGVWHELSLYYLSVT
jgi:hypothetical protein